jgi:hypothetical protein
MLLLFVNPLEMLIDLPRHVSASRHQWRRERMLIGISASSGE